jgi:hypothetical protein
MSLLTESASPRFFDAVAELSVQPPVPLSAATLRAPTEDGGLLVRPELNEAATVLAGNRSRLQQLARFDVQGRSLGELRQWAAREVYAVATAFTRYLDAAANADGHANELPESFDFASVSSSVTASSLPAASATPSLLVGGHQPELYHPGVWAKNLALTNIAQRTGATPLNLIVDSDVIPSRSIRVPVGSRLAPRIENIEWDTPGPLVPWEDVQLASLAQFESFGERVSHLMSTWGITPAIAKAWPIAVKTFHTTGSVAYALTNLRRHCERESRLRRDAITASQPLVPQLELPMSVVCQLPAFGWLACHFLLNAGRFRQVYNEAIEAYRVVNGVRSPNHPLPPLGKQEDWIESPFWVWRPGDKRDRLWTRQLANVVELRDEQGVFLTLPISSGGTACCAAEALATLAEKGIKLRTRALTTTLFARLLVGEAFVHGIGGAKYDEMTDAICTAWFGNAPPRFWVVSATRHLPLGGSFNVSRGDVARLAGQLRSVRCNAEQSADRRIPEATELQAASSQPVSDAGRRTCRALYQKLLQLRQQLQQYVRPTAADLQAELNQVQQQLEANKILRSREFSFVLFTEQVLAEMQADFC